MDYISLAERVGIDKEKAVYVYKRMNGGYYLLLYYSKPPITYSLEDWPLLYLKRRKHYPRLAEPGYNEAFQLLVTLDVYSIVGTSYFLLHGDHNVPYTLIEREMKEVYEAIKQAANQESLYPYPSMGEPIEADFTGFVKDIVEKRKRDDEEDNVKLFNEIAYNSEVMDNLKRSYPWAKTISEEKSLKAVSLANLLDKFLEEVKEKIFYLAAERTRIFDKILVERGIRDAVYFVKKSEIKDSPTNEFEAEVLRIIKDIKSSSSYL